MISLFHTMSLSKNANNNDNGIPVGELWKVLLGRLKIVNFFDAKR